MNGRRSLIGSLVHGSMASALAQGIGAQASHRSRQVVALAGDGGLTMMMGDLITLRQLNLPVKIVVFNNGSLAFVELEMKAAGFVNYGTELNNPDFSAVARAMGIHGVRVHEPYQLEAAMREAFATPGPAMVEVMVNRQELSLPPSITFAQAKGFSVWAAKTVLSGRGTEVIDLARTNLLQRILS
jgi:pyruvate dehydrogenase (quinone)